MRKSIFKLKFASKKKSLLILILSKQMFSFIIVTARNMTLAKYVNHYDLMIFGQAFHIITWHPPTPTPSDLESQPLMYNLPTFSPPHTSIFISYFPNSSNQLLSMVNNPPAIIGVLWKLDARISMTRHFKIHWRIMKIGILVRGGRVWIPLAGLTLSHCCAWFKQGPRFPSAYVVIFFVFKDLRQKIVVLFCCYLWNCWPSLFKSSFQN